MPRHSPCALISLTISSGSQKELCRSQKFSFLARIVVLPIIPQKICSLRLPAKHPLLPCFFLIFSIVQFSRCRFRSKTGSKHLNSFKCFDPFSGGDNRIRTDDLLRAKQALSHLSYTPASEEIGGPEWARTTDLTIISRTL